MASERDKAAAFIAGMVEHFENEDRAMSGKRQRAIYIVRELLGSPNRDSDLLRAGLEWLRERQDPVNLGATASGF